MRLTAGMSKKFFNLSGYFIPVLAHPRVALYGDAGWILSIPLLIKWCNFHRNFQLFFPLLH